MFPLGQIVITIGAQAVLENDESQVLLNSHCQGHWGNVSMVDKCMNEFAVEDGNKIMSRYRTIHGFDIVVITDAEDILGQRSKTTIALPQEVETDETLVDPEVVVKNLGPTY